MDYEFLVYISYLFNDILKEIMLKIKVSIVKELRVVKY